MKKIKYYISIFIAIVLLTSVSSQLFAAETTGTISNDSGGGVEGDVIADNTAPNAVNDLAVAVDGTVKHRINMTWSAPNDTDTDGAGTPGPAHRYILRYSTAAAITEGTWGNATEIANSMTPQAAGNGELFYVENLTPGTYHFAIKSADESGNNSAISNSPNDTVIDTRPTITNLSSAGATNAVDRALTITGTNYDGTPANNTVNMVKANTSISLTPTTATAATIDVTVPAGVEPGTYQFIVENNNGRSDTSADTYAVTEAATPLPVVTGVSPAIGANDTQIDIIIIGEHFFLNSVSDVTGVTINGIPLLNVNAESNTKTTATVPTGLADGVYDVKVTTSAGTNNVSTVKYESSTPTTINPGDTNDVQTTEVVDLSAFDGQGTTELAGEVELINNTSVQVNDDLEVLSTTITIPENTTITNSDGSQYTGDINPARIVDIDATTDNADEIDPDTGIIFQMGNPDQPIYFNTDVVIIFEIRANARPYLWFYNSYVSPKQFELAGKNATVEGITYDQGGTVLGLAGGVYTMGIVVDHMSKYVAGVKPVITSLTPDNGDLGDTVTIAGSNFHPNATVNFGGTAATATVNSTKEIVTTVPNTLTQGQTYNVQVVNPDNLNDTEPFDVNEEGDDDDDDDGGGGGGGGGGGYFEIPTNYTTNNELVKFSAYNSSVFASIYTPKEGSSYTDDIIIFTKDKSTQIIIPKETMADLTKRYGNDKKLTFTIEEIYKNRFTGKWPSSVDNGTLLISGTKMVKITMKDADNKSIKNFNPYIEIKMKYNFAKTANVDSASIYYYKEENKTWEKMKSEINKKKQTLTTQSDHLTYLAIFAYKKDVQVPKDQEVLLDIKDHWAYYYISELYNKGIVKGHGDTGMYKPNDPMNRAEFTKVAVLSFNNEPDEVSSNPFSDTPFVKWYARYVAFAKENKIVNGYSNGTFKPTRSINRAEALKILLKVADIDLCTNNCPDNPFTDTIKESWYEKYILTAYELGIIEGYNTGIFRPGSPITRAEVAKIIYKVLEL